MNPFAYAAATDFIVNIYKWDSFLDRLTKDFFVVFSPLMRLDVMILLHRIFMLQDQTRL